MTDVVQTDEFTKWRKRLKDVGARYGSEYRLCYSLRG